MTASIMPPTQAEPGGPKRLRMAAGNIARVSTPARMRVERIVGQVGDAVGIADTDGPPAVAGGGSIFQECARMPSRTSQLRLRSSSTS